MRPCVWTYWSTICSCWIGSKPCWRIYAALSPILRDVAADRCQVLSLTARLDQTCFDQPLKADACIRLGLLDDGADYFSHQAPLEPQVIQHKQLPEPRCRPVELYSVIVGNARKMTQGQRLASDPPRPIMEFKKNFRI